MEPALFTAERYRHEAARVRRAVMAMRDQLVRRGMFSVADQYDGLAEFVETRRRFFKILIKQTEALRTAAVTRRLALPFDARAAGSVKEIGWADGGDRPAKLVYGALAR